MKQIYEVPYPEIRAFCPSSSHYYNLLVDGMCFTCGAVWGLNIETERTVDAVVGVGDAPEQDERPHQGPPTDEEIDAMSEHYEKLTAML